MDLKDLLCDSSRQTAELGVAFVGKDPVRFEQMLNFALVDKPPFAMRAARVINRVSLKFPDLIQPHLNMLIQKLNKFNSEGLKRGMLKTLSERAFDYDEDAMGYLVDICFRWFNDPGEKIAVKIYALDLLYDATFRVPEIIPELISSIEHILPHASPGIKSKGRKLLKRLHKRRG